VHGTRPILKETINNVGSKQVWPLMHPLSKETTEIVCSDISESYFAHFHQQLFCYFHRNYEIVPQEIIIHIYQFVTKYIWIMNGFDG
jgi:hypothetical protein